jgi:hypothetical protein
MRSTRLSLLPTSTAPPTPGSTPTPTPSPAPTPGPRTAPTPALTPTRSSPHRFTELRPRLHLLRLLALILILAALTTALAARVEINNSTQNLGWPAKRLLGAAWLAFFLAIWLLRKIPARTAAVLILLGATAAGFASSSGHEHTSDDLYRYVWDGRVQAAGIDPYAYVPAAPELAGLRDPFLWPPDQITKCVHPGTADPDGGLLLPGCTLINRPAVHTIYPPVSEAYFLLVHELSPPGSRYKPIQLGAVALFLATTIALLLGLRALGRDIRFAALWAWCPLVAYESGNNAHVDVLAALFTVGALTLLALATRAGPAKRATRRYVLGAILLGLGVGAKLTPALALPAVLRRRPVLIATTTAGAFVAVYVPHVIAVGTKVIGFIPGYLNEQGYSSGSGYLLLSLILPTTWTSAAAVLIVAATSLAVLRYADPSQPWRGALVVTGTTMFVTTPPFPWYAVLIVALVALDGRIEWLALALATYAASITNGFGVDGGMSARFGYSLALLVILAATFLRRLRVPDLAGLAHLARSLS